MSHELTGELLVKGVGIARAHGGTARGGSGYHTSSRGTARDGSGYRMSSRGTAHEGSGHRTSSQENCLLVKEVGITLV